MEKIKDYEKSSGMSHKNIVAALNEVLAQKTLILAVLDGSDLPDMGVSPFIRRDDGLYIYTSHLSGHVRALLARESASFIIAVDENKSSNIWARHRLKFSGCVAELSRDDSQFSDICDEFATSHGNTMNLIRNFADFHMLHITPHDGILVLGFAKAFCVKGAAFEIVAHLSRS